MKSIKVFLVMILMAFAFSTTANAAFFNVAVARITFKGKNDNRMGILSGYVIGVVDTLDGTAFCIPAKLEIGDLVENTVRIVFGSGDDYESFAVAVTRALKVQYPC
jgi:hypothetical protein